MRNKKKKDIYILLIMLLGLTVGFALLSTTLKINGVAGIKSNTWNVYWDRQSIVVNEEGVSTDKPIVSGTGDTILTYNAELGLSGDFYEFTIDAVNNGTVDAMISDNIKITYEDEEGIIDELPSYLISTVTYSDGSKPGKFHLLKKREDENTPTREKYKVRIEYDRRSTTLAASDKEYTIHIEIPYTQADGNAIDRRYNAVQVISRVPTLVEDGTSDNVKRYVGADVSNYVYFNNNERWRILGVYGDNLKIILATNHTAKNYDDNGNNVWETSTLAQYLNSDTEGGYYYSIDETSKKMIEKDKTWYVGACDISLNAMDSYNSIKQTTWTGTVGILSTYEYLFSADTSCWTNPDSNCVVGKTWLGGEGFEWLMTPWSGYYVHAHRKTRNDEVSYMNVQDGNGFRPTVYLKSNVQIIDGDGSYDHPYVLK